MLRFWLFEFPFIHVALSCVQMKRGRMPRLQLAQVNEWKHCGAVSRTVNMSVCAISLHLGMLRCPQDVWLTGEWMIAWEINSSFSVSSSPSQIKSGGREGAPNGSFCSLSEGMMGLFSPFAGVCTWTPPNLIHMAPLRKPAQKHWWSW